MLELNKEDIRLALKYGYCKVGISYEDWMKIVHDCLWRKIVSDKEAIKKQLKYKICKYIEKQNLKPPIAVLFSGGVDSTFMLCMAREVFNESDLRCVIVNFIEKEFDESGKAIAILNAINFPNWYCRELHNPVEVQSKIYENNYYNLFFSSSIVPTYTAVSTASTLSDNILTGDGGDELFAGYDRYLWWYFRQNHRYLSKAIFKIKGNDLNSRSRKFLADNYLDLFSIWKDYAIKELYGRSPYWNMNIKTSIEQRCQWVLANNCHDYNSMMLADIGTELFGVEKYKVEQAQRMAGNPKIVSPFMDLDIIRYCMRLPIEYKVRIGLKRKLILRDIIKEYCPNYDKISGTKKKGFGAPVSKWIKESSGDIKRLNVRLGLFNSKALYQYIDLHCTDKVDYGEGLWAVWNLLYLVDRGIVEIK